MQGPVFLMLFLAIAGGIYAFNAIFSFVTELAEQERAQRQAAQRRRAEELRREAEARGTLTQRQPASVPRREAALQVGGGPTAAPGAGRGDRRQLEAALASLIAQPRGRAVQTPAPQTGHRYPDDLEDNSRRLQAHITYKERQLERRIAERQLKTGLAADDQIELRRAQQRSLADPFAAVEAMGLPPVQKAVLYSELLAPVGAGGAPRQRGRFRRPA